MKAIIFSKDRAAQLDFLLTSISLYCNWLAPVILYKSSTLAFQRGYDKLQGLYPKTSFIQEKRFKEDVLGLLEGPTILFLVDDSFFCVPFLHKDFIDTGFAQRDDVATLSLRMGLNINSGINGGMEKPRFISTRPLLWEWQGKSGGWGYPMTVDAHIYHTQMLKVKLPTLYFNGPNTLESIMVNSPLQAPLMMAFNQSKVFNCPLNRVQNSFLNAHMGIAAESLNLQFLQNKRLSIKPLSSSSPHISGEIIWR